MIEFADVIVGILGIVATIAISAVIGWVKVNRQIETLETRMESFKDELKRQDLEYSKIEALLAEIRTDLKRIEITLAKNHINE